MKLTGGCQCGAVRFVATGEVKEAAVCHCRMCQKAAGSVIWPFFTVKRVDLDWTRGKPDRWRSSNSAQRGFCAHCGTPLTFEPDGKETIDLSIGALDDPETLPPTHHVWSQKMIGWFDSLIGLPRTEEPEIPNEATAQQSFQHPDNPTDDKDGWPKG
ncbi:GFA family protein [Notoacmeibacter ruber]|uniref:GFA family protein n=1 Tax=Notoacmeibacter ruber TaxID=2670375 RepID=A0A3L7JAF2_9HYPH|nr:GFA family protein [Notoacmeibacter ruber]RLQ87606.1 GFA family protein [Notoacmeibacter ruber]